MANSASSISTTPRFRCFDPTSSYAATPDHPRRYVPAASNSTPRDNNNNNSKGTMGISANSEPKIITGDFGYVLEDVPHFTDYIPDLPVSCSSKFSVWYIWNKNYTQIPVSSSEFESNDCMHVVHLLLLVVVFTCFGGCSRISYFVLFQTKRTFLNSDDRISQKKRREKAAVFKRHFVLINLIYIWFSFWCFF